MDKSFNLNKYRIIVLFVLFWICYIISSIVLPLIMKTIYWENGPNEHTKIFLGQLFAYVIPLLIVVFLKYGEANFQKFYLFPLADIKPKVKINVLPYILLCILTFGFIHFLNQSIRCLTIYFSSSGIVSDHIRNFRIVDFLSVLLVYALIPAIIEETLFRGLYYITFKKNKYYLFVIPTIVFSMSHGSIIQSINAIILGLFLMLIIVKTNNIILVIVLHIIYNALSIIFANYIRTPISPTVMLDQSSNQMIAIGSILINASISLLFLLGFIIYSSFLFKSSKKSSAYYSTNDYTKKDKLYLIIFGSLLCLSAIIIFMVRL